MADKPNLDAAYSLKTTEDHREFYAAWADSYDDTFAKEHAYISPRNVAEAFVGAGGRGPVLDIGAGTGLCGAELKRLGVSDIHATDLSSEMLDVARAKKIYAHLFSGDILAGLDIPDQTYPGIVSSGTFTNGHVGPDGLYEVVRLLAPEGIAVLSINKEHFAASGFDTVLNQLKPRLASVSLSESRLYEEGAQGEHADDLGYLLTLSA